MGWQFALFLGIGGHAGKLAEYKSSYLNNIQSILERGRTYMFDVPSMSLTKRVNFYTSVIIGLLTLAVVVFSTVRTMQIERLKYEKNLYTISSLLGNHLSQSYNDILESHDALDKPPDEQIRILNSVLQPIVDNVFKQYPTYGMGYYSIKLDSNVAIEPNFSPSNLIPLPHSRPFFEVYETGKPWLGVISTSVSWGNSILNYTTPIYNNSRVIIGHSWANVNLHEMYVYLIKLGAITFLTGLIFLLILLFIIRKIFEQMEKEIDRLANAIVHNEQEISENLLPELKPVFHKIKNHIEVVNRMQSELACLDRLNLVGQMAAGIGHEIRNPMSTVRGYLQLLGMRKENEQHKPTYDIMISELDRANSIITEFLSLARNQPTELKSQNLNEILENIYPLIEADAYTQNKQIRLITGEIPELLLNSKKITQLIINLARNGLEAMEQRGCLTIKTFLDSNFAVLAVEDEGIGISPEDLEKLGTPFFTTKDNGTGLGLPICYRIADSHNAFIKVNSSSEGTTFYVRFKVDINDESESAIPSSTATRLAPAHASSTLGR